VLYNTNTLNWIL